MSKNTKQVLITKQVFARLLANKTSEVNKLYHRSEKRTHYWFDHIKEVNAHAVDAKKCNKAKGKPSKKCTLLFNTLKGIKPAKKPLTPAQAKEALKVKAAIAKATQKLIKERKNLHAIRLKFRIERRKLKKFRGDLHKKKNTKPHALKAGVKKVSAKTAHMKKSKVQAKTTAAVVVKKPTVQAKVHTAAKRILQSAPAKKSVTAKPAAPKAAKPVAPKAAKPVAPKAAKPAAPKAAKPAAPKAAKPAAPK